MTVSIECSNCGTKLRVPAAAVGRTGRCNNCDAKFTIVMPTAEVPDAPPKPSTEDFDVDDFLAIDQDIQARLSSVSSPPDLPPRRPRGPSAIPSTTSTSAAGNQNNGPRTVTSTQGIIIIGLLVIGFGWQVLRPAVYGAKWEYRIASPSDDAFETEIQKLGDEGWELVTARRATSASDSPTYEMIFKRQKR